MGVRGKGGSWERRLKDWAFERGVVKQTIYGWRRIRFV